MKKVEYGTCNKTILSDRYPERHKMIFVFLMRFNSTTTSFVKIIRITSVGDEYFITQFCEVLLTGEGRTNRRKICPAGTFYSTDSTCIGRGLSPGLLHFKSQ